MKVKMVGGIFVCIAILIAVLFLNNRPAQITQVAENIPIVKPTQVLISETIARLTPESLTKVTAELTDAQGVENSEFIEDNSTKEVAEVEPTVEPTPEVKEETSKVEAEPIVEVTPTTQTTPEPQAPTTNGISPENQAELEAKLAEMGLTLDEAFAGAPVVHQEPGEGGHSGLVWQ